MGIAYKNLKIINIMKTSTKIIWGVVIGIILLLIPVALNFVLQQEPLFCCQVITNEQIGSSATWLAFWGSYIAACASFSMAIVSHFQNKRILQHNIARVEYELALKQYEELEKFVLEADRIFSISAFDILCSYASKEGTDSPVFIKVFCEYEDNLNYSSSKSIKLLRGRGGIYEQYYQTLSTIYTTVKQLLDKFPMGEKGTINYNTEFQLICKDLESVDLQKIHELGFQCLDFDWKNVQEKLNNTK